MDNSFHLTGAQVRDLDRRAIHEFGVPGVVLMENAGRGAAALLARLNPDRQRVLILCGPGNNGGDGFVMARHLQNHGLDVDVWLFAPSSSAPGGTIRLGFHPQLTPDAAVNHQIWLRSGTYIINVEVDHPRMDPRQYCDHITLGKGWIVDAMFGTGLTRPLGPPFDEVVAAVNASGRPVLAVDIPSGLDCDTGEPLGPTLRATHTATFVAPKAGFQNPNARQWLGEVHVVDIGAPKKLVDEYRNQGSGIRSQESTKTN
jgi:NAD(P)H-hydrate epimerase